MEHAIAVIANAAIPHVKWFWHHVLDTNFSAALFGALAGALAAHGIASRAERRKRFRDEIAGVNNAMALALSISNTFIAVKRQHVIGMMARYQTEFARFAETIVHPPAMLTQFTFNTDFRSLQMPLTCISELRETILNRVVMCNQAISVSLPLHQSIDTLQQVLGRQDSMFAKLRELSVEDRIATYFGLFRASGSLDESYPTYMNAVRTFVDDGIYFPMLLCEILSAHGRQLRSRYGRIVPAVKSIEWQPFPNGILPDVANYPDFEKHFRPKPPAPSWRQLVVRRASNFGQLFSWGSSAEAGV